MVMGAKDRMGVEKIQIVLGGWFTIMTGDHNTTAFLNFVLKIILNSTCQN